MDAIFTRTSIRNYKQIEVEAEKIKRILAAGMAAPSAGNQQPWEFYVVCGKEKLKKLSRASVYAGCTAGAPLAFVPCIRKRGLMFESSAGYDMSCCCENMMLEAESLGLGTVWLGVSPYTERMAVVREALGIPQDLDPFAIIPCGYPVRSYKQEDRYNERVVHYAD